MSVSLFYHRTLLLHKKGVVRIIVTWNHFILVVLVRNFTTFQFKLKVRVQDTAGISNIVTCLTTH